MCRCIPRNSALIALLLFSISLFASTKHEITVGSASVQKNTALANAEVGSTHFQLECFLSSPNCRIPKSGRYLAAEAKPDEAIYQDCPNIDLYDRLNDGQQGPLIGTYCLSGDKATDILFAPKP